MTEVFEVNNPADKPDPLAEFEGYAVPGWDGYDAKPISAETLAAARAFAASLSSEELAEVDVAPGADGSIGFEWADRFVEVLSGKEE